MARWRLGFSCLAVTNPMRRSTLRASMSLTVLAMISVAAILVDSARKWLRARGDLAAGASAPTALP
jgi:hypothetical protein